MNTFQTSEFLREMKILMVISIVQDLVDFSEPGIYETYIEWEESMRWLIDLGRDVEYCIN